MSTVPVIDLGRFLHGDRHDRQDVAHETDAVCRDIGFLCITGHGVPEQVNTAIYDSAKTFFRQPTAEKLKVRQPGPEVIRGYIGMGHAALAVTRGEKTPPDLKETFSIGPERKAAMAENTPESGEIDQFAQNIWPEQQNDFRVTWLAYYDAMTKLSADMMRLFAAALDLEEDHFAPSIDRHISILSAMFYPDQADPPEPGQLRAGAHTDFGTMTILKPDAAPGGLQVQTKSGDWAAVKAPPGSYILNIGDLMARWTNDRWVSTLHRVVNPPLDVHLGAERLSIGFFHQPNYDARIACLPSCLDANGRAKYPEVTAGGYLQRQFSSQVVNAASSK